MTVGEFEAIVRKFSSDDETWWHFEVSAFINTFFSLCIQTLLLLLLLLLGRVTPTIERGCSSHLDGSSKRSATTFDPAIPSWQQILV